MPRKKLTPWERDERQILWLIRFCWIGLIMGGFVVPVIKAIRAYGGG